MTGSQQHRWLLLHLKIHRCACPQDGADEGGGHRKDIQDSNLSFLNASSHALDHREQPVGEWDYLNNFFKRSNKVCTGLAQLSSTGLGMTPCSTST